MVVYSVIDNDIGLDELVAKWGGDGVASVAMDFEEESNLHCYGEYVCTMQLFDGSRFYLVDCLALSRTEEGRASLRAFLEGPIEKVMFACQSDAALARKTLGIQLANIYDIRILAMALGLTGNLSSLEEKYIKADVSEASSLEASLYGSKKKFQTANWMRRPIPRDQIVYALGDVEHLFELRAILEEEVSQTLSVSKQKEIAYEMKRCALAKNPERPGWEKICNYRLLGHRERVFIKHYFLARDSVARRRNVPASRVLAKQDIVGMAKAQDWRDFVPVGSRELEAAFSKAHENALKELRKPVV